MCDTIKINGIEVDIKKINLINIVYVSDENDTMYITIDLADKGVIHTISTNQDDVDGWDRLTDVCSVRGTKEEVLSEIGGEFCVG